MRAARGIDVSGAGTPPSVPICHGITGPASFRCSDPCWSAMPDELWRRPVAHGLKRPQTKSLHDDKLHISRIETQIATPQPPGLTAEPEHPLQADSLQAGRCLPQSPGVKIERGADGQQWERQQMPHLVNPALLTGTAHPDEHDHGPTAANPVGHVLLPR